MQPEQILRRQTPVFAIPKVTAPFDGVIGISLVKVGAAVTAGQTILNTVSTDNQLAVDFNVDQKEIYRFTNLLKNAKSTDSTFTLHFGTDIYPYPGKIPLIDRAVDPQTGTIKTRLIFPNKDNHASCRYDRNRACSEQLLQKDLYLFLTKRLQSNWVNSLCMCRQIASKVSQRKLYIGRADRHQYYCKRRTESRRKNCCGRCSEFT